MLDHDPVDYADDRRDAADQLRKEAREASAHGENAPVDICPLHGPSDAVGRCRGCFGDLPVNRAPIPYYDDGRIRIYHGDTLEILRSLPDDYVDAVVTDPPYASGTRKEASKSSSGAMVRGERFGSSPIDLDQMTTTGFVWLMRNVGLAAYDLLPPGGAFLSFIDWRQWSNLVGALETCNYRVQDMLIWDKQAMGMGNGFRNQHELVVHASKGVPNVHHRGTSNVLSHKRDRKTKHPSPKPVPLMSDLLRVVMPEGGIVVDPFMGSGATLVAAKEAGLRAIGIEGKREYCELAAERIAGTLDLCGQPLAAVGASGSSPKGGAL